MIPWIVALLCAQAQGASAPGDAGKETTQQQDSKVQDRLDDQEDRIKDLERRLAESEKRQSQTTSANPFTVLNPRMTVSGDFLWRADDKRVYVDNNPLKPPSDRIDDTVNMREVEMDLRASVDPFVDAVAVISVGSEIPGQFDVEVEEFYAIVKSLPLPSWETPPLGTKIKVGRFRTAFGLNNISHTHDLPQSDRPLVVREFLGEDGMVANGIATSSFLPSPGDTALELNLQVLGGGNSNVAEDRNRLSYLANLNWFVPIADEHSLNVSAIGFYGVDDHDAGHQNRVASLDLLYKWKPLKQGEYNCFLFGGQMMYASHEFTDPLGAGERTHPFGYTVWAQYQMFASLYAGVRWDQTDMLTDDTMHRKQVSPYLTWYTSEFFRARFTYQHTWSDNPVEAGLDSFFVELVVVFGAHPPEPFWVNK
ncbi:MAG TPA: hypothetical protein VE981_20505 [Planctomycetota bacterium]|nr:hypothetical protein [Planctomycetota bacterium]